MNETPTKYVIVHIAAYQLWHSQYRPQSKASLFKLNHYTCGTVANFESASVFGVDVEPDDRFGIALVRSTGLLIEDHSVGMGGDVGVAATDDVIVVADADDAVGVVGDVAVVAGGFAGSLGGAITGVFIKSIPRINQIITHGK